MGANPKRGGDDRSAKASVAPLARLADEARDAVIRELSHEVADLRAQARAIQRRSTVFRPGCAVSTATIGWSHATGLTQRFTG